MTNDEIAEISRNYELEANESNGLMVSDNGLMVSNDEWTSTKSTTYTNLKFVKIVENCDSIELIYKENPNVNYFNQFKVFKIVFSCKDGKWNKSERIYGSIIPESQEDYEFP